MFLNRGSTNHWIKIKLVSTSANSNAYNARVRVVADGLTQFRELFSATGYKSADDTALLFGLGQYRNVDIIEVTWPGRNVQTLSDVNAGQALIIREGE